MPRPTETDLMEDVFIDETSQSGHRFLVLGGLTIPYYLYEEFDAYIAKARTRKLAIRLTDKMTLSEMGRNDIGKGDFDVYQKVMEAYFSFAQTRLKTTLIEV